MGRPGDAGGLDRLAHAIPATRVLLIITYRPECSHEWANLSHYTQLRVEPLPRPRSQELLSSLLGDDPSLQPLNDVLVERTQGNPFFLEESIRTLIESGVLNTGLAPVSGQPHSEVIVRDTVQRSWLPAPTASSRKEAGSGTAVTVVTCH